MSVGAPSAFESRDEKALELTWRHYAEEAEAFDKETIKSWQTGLDGRVLFASPSSSIANVLYIESSQSTIFSAILTPFLLESYKLLQPTNGEPSPGFFGKDGYKIRVNAFWFSGLVLSMICVLLATQARTWLDHYQVGVISAHSRIPLKSNFSSSDKRKEH
jgi:hypothetical protein